MSLSESKKTIINPKTQRPIVVGGATWRKLVHDNVLAGDILAPVNEVYRADSKQEAIEAVKVLKKTNPAKKGYELKRGTDGKKVIQAKKRMTQKQLQQYMMKCSTKVIQQERDNINPDMTEPEINDYLSEKILTMMLSDGKVTEKDFDRFTVKKPESENEQSETEQSETEQSETECSSDSDE
jgi:hypothetical protein